MFFRKPSIAVAAALVVGVPLSAHAAPSVSWSAPKSGATISGTISGSACAASVSSSVSMSRVTFWADGMQINNDYSSPWNCNFDSTKLKDGTRHSPEEIEQAYMRGASAYIRKPNTLQEYEEACRHTLRFWKDIAMTPKTFARATS